ncbi:MAG TPA: PDZ domain-containing protein [Novosphingobium sp.]|nr:PDZ domain-containing protein [Novosphingobium sp.]
MTFRAALAGALVLAVAVTAPARAAPIPAAFAELQALDARVQSVGWKLAHGNARFCREVLPGIGLQLQDVANFSDPAAVRAALGLSGEIAVEAVAEGSPAARAGLAANDTLSAVAGIDVSALPQAKPGDYARLVGLHDRIDAALRTDGRVELVGAGKALTLAGEPVCATRFEMLSGGQRAAADGRRVVIGRKLVETLPEDELLAAALAHELAHNVLGHRARLDASGRAWSKVKATEREADRLMPWLLVNAGYDPEAALRFFGRWGPANDYGIFSSPDHDRPKTRARRIAAEIATMRAVLGADGRADWARDFKTLGG